MTLPGVGVFSGDNTTFLVKELRKAGFPIRAVWAAGKKATDLLQRELGIECCTTDIKELVIRADVDLVIIDSPPPTHSQIATNALRIGKHVICSLPAGLNLSDAKKMIQASCYYPTLLAAASSPLRFLDQIQRIKNMVQSGKPGRVLVIEAKFKDNMEKCEKWKLDNRMGGGSLSLLAAYITDIVSHILNEHATRVHSFSVRSPVHSACDSFTTFHLSFPTGVSCSANVAFSTYFEFELTLTCSNFIIRLDSELNVTTHPENAIYRFDSNGKRPESGIESDTEPETGNETEVETEDCSVGDNDNDDEGAKTAEMGVQVTVEKRNIKTETSCGHISSNIMPLLTRGMPILIDCIKHAFMDGGYDPRAWDQKTLDSTPVANFGDILYIQGVLDAARRSDRSGEWESVEINEEHDSTLKFQDEMSLYCEVVDQLQI